MSGRRARIGAAARAAACVLAVALGAAAATPAQADLAARIEAFVRARAPYPPTRVEVPALGDLAPPGHAGADLAVHLGASANETWSGSVPITVVFARQGREVGRSVVTTFVELERPALVAARSLPRGTRVRPEDIREVRRGGAPLAGQVSDPQRLVGQRTARAVPEGAVWRRGLVRSAPLVSRGQPVRLRLVRGPLRIEAIGKARDDGRAGDRVRVLNTSSRREVIGEVAADGTVHVAF